MSAFDYYIFWSFFMNFFTDTDTSPAKNTEIIIPVHKRIVPFNIQIPIDDREIQVFKKGGGERMAMEMNVPFLGSIPIDPQLVEASDKGVPFVSEYSKTETAKAFEGVVQAFLTGLGET